MKKTSAFLYKIFLLATIICVVLLLLSELSTYLNPGVFWLTAILGLLFPVFYLIVIVFAICWFFINKKIGYLCVIVLLVGIIDLFNSYAFYTTRKFVENRSVNSVRIITWNVGLMNFTAPDVPTALKQNKVILDQLKLYNADIICLQEFFTAVTPNTNLDFIDSIGRTMDYPYHYFSKDNPYFSETYYSGSIIFSKYRILEAKRYAFPDHSLGSLIKTSLLVQNDTVSVYTTRLQSMGFKPYEYEVINNIKSVDNEPFRGSGNVIRKLKKGYAKKGDQVKMIHDLLQQDKKPIIFTGDFNDVPTSYAYHKIKGNMDDAWLHNGFGMGRTFKFISPTLRIDYILYNHFFTATQTKRIITTGSDHYGLVTDLTLNKAAE